MIADAMTGLVTRHYLTNRAHVATVSETNTDDVVDWLIFHEAGEVEIMWVDATALVRIATDYGTLYARSGQVITVDPAGVRVMSAEQFTTAYEVLP